MIQYYKIRVGNMNLIKFFSRRRYFIKSYYKSVLLLPVYESEIVEIENLIRKHKLEFNLYGNVDMVQPHRMCYTLSLNFCLLDSNLNKFKTRLKKMFSTLRPQSEEHSMTIEDYRISTFNNIVTKIEISTLSYESVEDSKVWFDYYFAPKFNNFLKKYYYKSKSKH